MCSNLFKNVFLIVPESFLFKALFTIFYFLGAIYKRQKRAFNRNAVRIETKNVLFKVSWFQPPLFTSWTVGTQHGIKAALVRIRPCSVLQNRKRTCILHKSPTNKLIFSTHYSCEKLSIYLHCPKHNLNHTVPSIIWITLSQA